MDAEKVPMDDAFKAVLMLEKRGELIGKFWGIEQAMGRYLDLAGLLAKHRKGKPNDDPFLLSTAGDMAEQMDFINRMSRDVAFRLIDLLKRAHEEQRRQTDGR